MLSLARGYDPGYLTTQVARGAEGYYLSATAGGGEPPGRWTGRGCAELGLAGRVENDVMTDLYAHLIDPRDPARRATLGSAPRVYKSPEQIAHELLKAEGPNATPERVAEIEAEAARKARNSVMFFDATFSPSKSVSLLHAGFQAAALAARAAGDLDEAARLDAAAEVVWAAVRAGSAASLDFLQDEAGYTRTGYHGSIPRDPVTGRKLADHSTGKFEPAHEWVIASFDQHTSRDNDPQLHIHNAILNRVKCADGEYRTLDSRALYKTRQAAATIGERVMEEQLTRELGVQWAMRADGKSREMVGITDATRAAFSSRRATITAGVAELVAEFTAKHGHEPSRRTVFHMAQFVTVESRVGKTHGPAPDRAAMLARWEEQATAAELGALATIPADVVGRVDLAQARSVVDLADAEMQRVLQAAIAEVEQERATWNRHHLTVAINRQLPDGLGGLPADLVRRLLTDLTDEALAPGAGYGIHRLDAPSIVAEPAGWTREDGSSIYAPHDRARYATARQLQNEDRLTAAASERGAPEVDADRAALALGGDRSVLDALLSGATPARGTSTSDRRGQGHGSGSDGPDSTSGEARAESDARHPGALLGSVKTEWRGGLRDDQAAAVYGIVTSGRRIDILVGPAGAGKSRAMGELSSLWQEQVGGRVVGLAVSQSAAEVLAGEGCTDTLNVAAFLVEARAGRGRLAAGDMVVIDEASMTSPAQLAEINVLAEAAGAKLLLTGDPEQLGDGPMAMLARDHGYYQLTEVQRMREAWEREASLLLRRGDASALRMYDDRGRLLEGTGEQMTEAAYRRWLADHLAGKDTMLLASTTAEARELAGRARAELVELGLVQEQGQPVRDGQIAGVGDRVMARHNMRHLIDVAGRWVTNRDVMRIDEWIYSPDREQTEPIAARVRRDLGPDEHGVQQWSEPYAVGAGYLEQHAELAYASTVHAAQGRTVDTCHNVVRPGIGRSMLYVMMTRGREASYAYTVAEPNVADLEPGAAPAPEIAEAARRAEREAAGVPTAGAAIHAAAPAGHERYAVLADALETEEGELTATEVVRDEHLRATHLGHLGVLWTEATRQASERRLDAVMQELLTDDQYARYADRSESGPRGTLHRLVRAAELAGHDAAALVREVVTAREIDEDGARAESIAKVVHHRVKHQIGTDTPRPLPTTSYAERTPTAVDGPGADRLEYAREVAAVMDARTVELGAAIAEQVPEWAERHLGPVPAEPLERVEWEQRAGCVQAHREQFDKLDERTAIGHCPDSPEARASWHAAYDALGRPEEERDLAAKTTGDLLVVREKLARLNWFAPERVAEELRDTAAAHDQQRAEAELAAKRAEVALDPGQRAELKQEAADRLSLAAVLAAEQATMTRLHEAREAWVDATAGVREEGIAAEKLLAERLPDVELPPIAPEPILPEVSLARDYREEERQADRDAERQKAEEERQAQRDREAAEAKRVHEGQLTLDLEETRDAERQADREAEQAEADRTRAEQEAEQARAEEERQAQRDREAAELAQQQELELGIGKFDDGTKARGALATLVEKAKAATRYVTRVQSEQQERLKEEAELELAERDEERQAEDSRRAVRQRAERRREDERARSVDLDERVRER